MQEVSQKYKELMKRKWIDQMFHVRVSIGVINQAAQSSVKVGNQGECEYYSNFYKPLNNYAIEELYAACDKNYTVIGKNMYFLPREKEMAVLNQGIVTTALSGAILFSFPDPYDIKGLTIEFGDIYPIDFTIESDNGSVEISGNSSGHFETEEVFDQATYLKIIPSEMLYGENRLRIHQLMTGIGIYFSGHEIKSATKQEYISPVGEELPTVDFKLTVENRDRKFDIENHDSSVNFLEIGQEVEVLYGQDLDDGSTEWMPGTNLLLTEWSVDDDEMTFTASDRFLSMNETYYKGKYYPEGISLYDLAIDVLQDADIDLRTVWLDPYLKNVVVNNPMPVVTHKEALQLIANAGRCVLSQGRNGDIYLKSSFRADLTAESQDGTYYGTPSSVLDGKEKKEYASVSSDYTEIEYGMYFLPRDIEGAEFLDAGYVSQEISDENGCFSKNPKVTIRAEAAFKCFGLTLHFGRTYPEELKILTYYGDELQEEIVVSDVDKKTVVYHEFAEWDMLALEFTKGKPHNRIFLHNIIFGEDTDYTLEYECELTKAPKGKQLQKVKEVQIVRTLYSKGQEADIELARETISVTAADNQYTMYFSNPSYGLSCLIVDAKTGQSIEIIDQSCYYATVELSGVSGAVEVIITGREYIPSYAKVVRSLHTSGAYEVFENPLVSDVRHAADLADWIGDYLMYDKEYEIEYRGDPKIDGNDLAYLENKYVQNIKIRIYQHTLDYNGGLSGTIKARRVD